MKKQITDYTKKSIFYLISLLSLNTTVLSPAIATNEEKILNVYTARHYNSDKKIYKIFKQETGIMVREVSSKDQVLLEKLKSEGSASPADVIILADAARLWRAEEFGFFQQHGSTKVIESVPKQF